MQAGDLDGKAYAERSARKCADRMEAAGWAARAAACAREAFVGARQGRATTAMLWAGQAAKAAEEAAVCADAVERESGESAEAWEAAEDAVAAAQLALKAIYAAAAVAERRLANTGGGTCG